MTREMTLRSGNMMGKLTGMAAPLPNRMTDAEPKAVRSHGGQGGEPNGERERDEIAAPILCCNGKTAAAQVVHA
jgi:hypothetical protein